MSEKSVFLCLVLMLLRQEFAISIRITELTVPSYAVEGGSILLHCSYDLEGDLLYSMSWYKDRHEFFRYVPSNVEPLQYFPRAGVHVDIMDSSSSVVKLVNLTSESAGVYRCEVSGEAPYFRTDHDEKNISVHLLPHSRPQIAGLKEDYKIGEYLAINCTSSRSRPKTNLKWIINNESVSRRYVTGPWYRISRERPDATETILQLRFIVLDKHFNDGIMQIKCQSSIAPLYQDETVHHIVRAEDNLVISEDLVDEEINKLFEQHTQERLDEFTEMPLAESQNKGISITEIPPLLMIKIVTFILMMMM